jgi:hypothetical protein
MKIRTILTAAIFGLLLIACKKKDTAISKSDLLISGTWKLTAVVSDDDGNGTYETNEYASFPVCFTDNFYAFHSTHKFVYDEGPTKCDPLDPQTDEVSWQLADNEATLMIDSDPYSILQLDNQTLRVKEDLGSNRSTMTTFTKR